MQFRIGVDAFLCLKKAKAIHSRTQALPEMKALRLDGAAVRTRPPDPLGTREQKEVSRWKGAVDAAKIKVE